MMNFRKNAVSFLIGGASVLASLQCINAQQNPFNPVEQKQIQEQRNLELYESNSQIINLDNISLESKVLGEFEGTIIASGSFDLTRNTINGPVRLQSEIVQDDMLETPLKTLLEVMETYPPYMLKERCNIHAIYLTANIVRNNERLNGLALSEGIILLGIRDIPIDYNFFELKRIAHHEIFHGCEFGIISNREEFDNQWITIAREHNAEIEYIGDAWKNLNHSATYPGVSRTYSKESPTEHRATTWEDIITNYTHAHWRFREDPLYQKYFYKTIQLMREWSNGLMDHEVYGLIARKEIVDRDYYIRTFGDNSFLFAPNIK